MAGLFTLPAELLISIFEEIGGRELRRSSKSEDGDGWRATDRLAICHEWYAVARPIYLSGLGTSDVRLYASTLKDLDGKFSYKGLRTLMQKNTRNLSIKLLGHFWDQNFALHEELSENVEYDELQIPNNQPPGFDLQRKECQIALRRWRDVDLKPRLDEILTDLRHFTSLEEMELTASSDPDGNGQDWDYIELSSVLGLLKNLPLAHDLHTLTLDTCGTRLLGDDGKIHICEEIAIVLPMIQTVRLRMITLCPAILDLPKNIDTVEVKLRTLVIKLHLPSNFQHTFDQVAEPCVQMRAFSTRLRLDRHLRRAVPSFLSSLSRIRNPAGNAAFDHGAEHAHPHGLKVFSISYRDQESGELCSLDCLNMLTLYLGHWAFAYHDDGRWSWDELEELGQKAQYIEDMRFAEAMQSRRMTTV